MRGHDADDDLRVLQSLSEIMRGWRDIQDGYELLVSHKSVDPDRIGVLGALLAANYALYGAKANPKLKAIAMLDPVIWAWGEAGDRETLNSVKQPVLLFTGEGMGELTKQFAQTVAENELNEVVRYPGSIVAYLRFREDGRLRQPRFLGLRDDKRPAEVNRERPA